MAEGPAYNRIAAACAARRFPVIFEMVAAGRLHVTGIKLLSPRLSPDNQADLLEAAAKKSTRAIEQLLAERFPARDARAWIRKLPARSSNPAPAPAVPVSSPPPSAPVPASSPAPSAPNRNHREPCRQ